MDTTKFEKAISLLKAKTIEEGEEWKGDDSLPPESFPIWNHLGQLMCCLNEEQCKRFEASLDSELKKTLSIDFNKLDLNHLIHGKDEDIGFELFALGELMGFIRNNEKKFTEMLLSSL